MAQLRPDRDDLETLSGYEDTIQPHVRRLRTRATRHRLRESLLFIPLLMLGATVVVEQLLRVVDDRGGIAESPLDMPPDAAVALLSTIAGATITTVGVVFSLLVVSLQLASGQFSPRVLRTFWRDRFGQVLIGLLLATFTFCVLALTQVDTGAERAPTLTMLGAVGLALGSIVAIAGYLNRITRQQYVGRIMERIAAEGLELVAELPYGPRVGTRVGDPVPPPDVSALGAPLVVRSHLSGWVQQISRRAVLGAVPPDSVLRLETRVGAFVTCGTPLVTIWPGPAHGTAARIADLLDDAFVVGATRTMQQDVDFSLRQLNDIGLRALSAAVNDPTTAIEALLRVGTIMRPLLIADLPAQCVKCDGNRILLTPWDLDHVEYVGHAFDQTRVYAAPHPQIVLAFARTLRMLRAACAAMPERAEVVAALDHQLAELLAASGRAGLTPADLDRIAAAARPPE
jgi:uncharacterized membrane protein